MGVLTLCGYLIPASVMLLAAELFQFGALGAVLNIADYGPVLLVIQDLGKASVLALAQ